MTCRNCGQVEARHRDQRGAPVEGEVQQHGHAVDVEEGQERQDAVVGVDVEHRRALHDVGDQVGVAELHALGESGGAR